MKSHSVLAGMVWPLGRQQVRLGGSLGVGVSLPGGSKQNYRIGRLPPGGSTSQAAVCTRRSSLRTHGKKTPFSNLRG